MSLIKMPPAPVGRDLDNERNDKQGVKQVLHIAHLIVVTPEIALNI